MGTDLESTFKFIVLCSEPIAQQLISAAQPSATGSTAEAQSAGARLLDAKIALVSPGQAKQWLDEHGQTDENAVVLGIISLDHQAGDIGDITSGVKPGTAGVLCLGDGSPQRRVRAIPGGRRNTRPAAGSDTPRKLRLQLELLTDSEQRVLKLLSEGLSTKDIAEKLFVSPRTIETHRSQVCHKLQMTSVAELTRFALKAGLTKLEPD